MDVFKKMDQRNQPNRDLQIKPPLHFQIQMGGFSIGNRSRAGHINIFPLDPCFQNLNGGCVAGFVHGPDRAFP